MISRTYGQIHFSDLDPKRFEMLTMQIIYKMRRWEKLEHLGAAGSDDGIDINAVELLENGKRDVHHFQCKRYDRLTKSQIEGIVRKYVQDNPKCADYYYLVCGCNPTKKATEGFHAECEKAGIRHHLIWSASYLETLLYSDYHDILFAYFGVNLSMERNNTINAIRRNVVLKKRMHADFSKKVLTEKEKYSIRYKNEYWKKFISSEILIRSIYDKSYPNNDIMPGFFKAEIYNWYHNGLEIYTYPYVVTAKVKQPKLNADFGADDPNEFEIVEQSLDVFGCIPFENIIEYDIDGDEFYRIPHLYCDYQRGSDLFEEIRYRTKDGMEIKGNDIVEYI